jgi:hypothetical protein
MKSSGAMLLHQAGKSRGGIAATYPYYDEDVKLLYQVLRYERKGFSQRRPDGKGDWVENMDGVTRVPFNLPEVVRSNVVLIAEGEKDALKLQEAASHFPDDGAKLIYAATTNVGGAGKWQDEYSPYLAGKTAFIFQDNDDAGRKHAQQICSSVQKHAREIRLVELPNLPEKGDVSEYLASHSSEELFEQMQTAPVWSAPGTPDAPSKTPEAVAKMTRELFDACRAWILRYVIVTGEQATILAFWLLHAYVLAAADMTPYIHITAAEKECGKSLLMDVLAALAFNPKRSGGMTPAALVRTIDGKPSTLFLDEMDAAMGGSKEYAENMRGILSEGFHRGGTFSKCDGKIHEVRDFSVFGCKVLAGIGCLPGTVASRSITIEMRRKLPSENVEVNVLKARIYGKRQICELSKGVNGAAGHQRTRARSTTRVGCQLPQRWKVEPSERSGGGGERQAQRSASHRRSPSTLPAASRDPRHRQVGPPRPQCPLHLLVDGVWCRVRRRRLSTS